MLGVLQNILNTTWNNIIRATPWYRRQSTLAWTKSIRPLEDPCKGLISWPSWLRNTITKNPMQWLNHHDSFLNFFACQFSKKNSALAATVLHHRPIFLGNRSRSWYKCHLVICEAFRSVLVTLLIFCLKQSNTAQKDKTRPCSKPYDTSRYTCIYTLNYIYPEISSITINLLIKIWFSSTF